MNIVNYFLLFLLDNDQKSCYSPGTYKKRPRCYQQPTARTTKGATFMATASLVDVSLAVEAEFDRIKRARPHLASRINRAGHILTVHLSCPRQRMIKVRVRDGQARFLVNGSEGTVYVVDPADWSCSCPDAMQRGKGCKHGIACYVLSKADT